MTESPGTDHFFVKPHAVSIDYPEVTVGNYMQYSQGHVWVGLLQCFRNYVGIHFQIVYTGLLLQHSVAYVRHSFSHL